MAKAKKQPRPYSFDFQAQGTPRRYLLSGIPPTLWEGVRRQAKREGKAVRQVILTLLKGWLAHSEARARGRAIIPAVTAVVAARESAASPRPGTRR
jgi:hypothetical protein